MIINTSQIDKISETNLAHRREEAQKARLIKEVKGDKVSFRSQLLIKSGQMLVALGHKLQTGSKPVSHHTPKFVVTPDSFAK